MQDYISQNLTAIVLAAIALLAGITITLKVIMNRNRIKTSQKDNSNTVVQQGNVAGGDIVGRDKKE